MRRTGQKTRDFAALLSMTCVGFIVFFAAAERSAHGNPPLQIDNFASPDVFKDESAPDSQSAQPPQSTGVESSTAQTNAATGESRVPLQTEVGFLWKQLKTDSGLRAYTVYVPPEYTPHAAWPVILFLHGSEQRGDDGLRPTVDGIAEAVRRNRKLCPAVIVFPQCPEGQNWSGPTLEMALRCVEATSHEYHLDPQRCYIAGQSLGGAGVLEALTLLPEHFAAGASMAGFIGHPTLPPEPAIVARVAPRLAKTPLWLYHGSADKNVNPAHSQELSRAINAVGGATRYTEVPEAGHNVWDRAYADARFWQWLLSQRRVTSPAAGVPTSAPAP